VNRAMGLCMVVAIASLGVFASSVEFPDDAVEAAIRIAIEKPTGELDTTDLMGLVALAANGQNITNLEGMQYCVNLSTLSLRENQIVDITPLTGLLNLAELHLEGNEITSIRALADNMGLGVGDWVSVDMNFLDLTFGSPNRQAVEALQGRGAHIEFECQNPLVVSFPDPELEVVMRDAIDIPAGDILNTDLAVLTELDVEDWGVLSVEGLQHCVNLEWLDLRDNEISDPGPLAGLINLTFLELGNNVISDIGALASLANLEELHLYNNWIVDISVLGELIHLEQLDLRNNRVGDISPLLTPGVMGLGDIVDVQRNQLDLQPDSQDVLDIEALQTRGVTVIYDPQS
jgi:large repetitive protein